MPANQSPFSSLDCSHLLLSYSPWTLHWIFISPLLPQGQTVICDVVLELRGKLQSEAAFPPFLSFFFFFLSVATILACIPCYPWALPYWLSVSLQLPRVLLVPGRRLVKINSAVILSTEGWSHGKGLEGRERERERGLRESGGGALGRGGEWAWCRFAFPLMHTERPPALSSFYRVCLPHLHPIMAALYMPFHCSFQMYMPAPAMPRAVLLGMCFWPPELTLRWQA